MSLEKNDVCLCDVQTRNTKRSFSLQGEEDRFPLGVSTLSSLFILGQSENSVAILLSGYSFVSLRHETMASITDSIS